MTLARDRWSPVRGHPFLAVYLVALVLVWIVTATTWTVRGTALELHPVAQGLQYLLVAIAATLAALRLRVEVPEEREDARFGFYDLRWTVVDDIGGRTFWTAIGFGVAAMLANIGLLVMADILVAGGSQVGTYLAWMGGGIAAGAVVGMFSALAAAVGAAILRRARRD